MKSIRPLGMTDIKALMGKVKKFCELRDWDQFHTPKDLAIGLSTESGELLQHFRFLNEEQCNRLLCEPGHREKIGDELADVFFFILRFADLNNFDLGEELTRKLVKNEKKYPVELFRGKNEKSNLT